MPTKKYWEDYQVGQTMTTPCITITESHLVAWSGLTMDFYPLHMDKEYAENSALKGRVAHGPLLFAMSVGLMSVKEFMEYDSIIAWLGSDVKMVKPVYIGDTICVDSEIVEKKETSKPHQAILRWLYRIKNQNNDVVMENTMTFMMHRKPQAA